MKFNKAPDSYVIVICKSFHFTTLNHIDLREVERMRGKKNMLFVFVLIFLLDNCANKSPN